MNAQAPPFRPAIAPQDLHAAMQHDPTFALREYLAYLHIARYAIEMKADSLPGPTRRVAWEMHANIVLAIGEFLNIASMFEVVAGKVAYWASRTITMSARFEAWLELDDPSWIWREHFWVFEEFRRFEAEIAAKCGREQAFALPSERVWTEYGSLIR